MSNYTNAADPFDFDPEGALAPLDGPYGLLDPRQFYERNPGLYFKNGTRAGTLPVSFQPEIGSVGTPVTESLRQFMSEARLRNFPR
eukprot:5390179-Pyramimonas_sp.AAC.1